MLENIELDKIVLNQHKILSPRGAIWHRAVYPGWPPLEPTGRESRFVSEPPGFNPSKYAQGLTAGTGATCYSFTLETSFKETSEMTEKDVYRVTLLKDIELVDLDSICKKQGIAKPYMPEERTDFFDQFYGKHIKGLRFESAKHPSGYNVVIFNDWFKDFPKYVVAQKLFSLREGVTGSD